MSVLPISPRPSALDDQASRLRAMLAAESDTAPRRLAPRPPMIALASGKGGVGKTFTSISIASALAALGRRTTLIDADFGAANADIMLGLAPLRRLDECMIKGFARGHSLADIAIDSGAGFRLVPGPVGMGRPPSSADRQRLVHSLTQLHGLTDVALMDCSAGVSMGVLDLVASADLAVVVLTPEPTSIADAYALIKSLVRQQGPEAGERLGLVVNQTHARGEAERVHRRIAAVARKFLGIELALYGQIPSDRAVVRGVREQCVARGGKLTSPSGKAARKAAGIILAELERRTRTRDVRVESCAPAAPRPQSETLGIALGRW